MLPRGGGEQMTETSEVSVIWSCLLSEELNKFPFKIHKQNPIQSQLVWKTIPRAWSSFITTSSQH